jgi:hypothetical protein
MTDVQKDVGVQRWWPDDIARPILCNRVDAQPLYQWPSAVPYPTADPRLSPCRIGSSATPNSRGAAGVPLRRTWPTGVPRCVRQLKPV